MPGNTESLVNQIVEGDCVEVMKSIPDSSVHSIVCDPPYGLEFMGKEWDKLARPKPGNIGGFADGNKPSFERVKKHLKSMQEWHLAWAKEAFRVLKPGGHLLAFGGTRTYHRLVCAIEDAGFEIRDCIVWVYAQGFPKSLDVSKAIDRVAGAERDVVGMKPTQPGLHRSKSGANQFTDDAWEGDDVAAREITAPKTDKAKKWSGWGSALKPAQEPIVVARKPLSEGTLIRNVMEHGTGALNIDGCRIKGNVAAERGESWAKSGKGKAGPWHGTEYKEARTAAERTSPLGRWPTNFVLSHLENCEKIGSKKVKGDARKGQEGDRPSGFYNVGSDKGSGKPAGPLYGDADGTETVDEWQCAPGCPVAALDAQSGTLRSGTGAVKVESATGYQGSAYGKESRAPGTPNIEYGDEGGASRFFYTSKASPDERWFWCPTCKMAGQRTVFAKNESCPKHGSNPKTQDLGPLFGGTEEPGCACWKDAVDAHKDHELVHHPTVKPLELMKWLVRLVTPHGGIVLDPFVGSGTTAIAALLENFPFIGIEKQAEYVEIARARLASILNPKTLVDKKSP